jgi:hypothetical protein
MLGWVLQHFKTIATSFIGSALLYLALLIVRTEKSFADISEIKSKQSDMEKVIYTVNAQYLIITKQLEKIDQKIESK